jgi:hypothetical protein
MFCSTVMMGGMMLPSAAPMILTFAAAQARRGRNVAGPTWIFIAAYILVWSYSGLVFMSFSMLARIWCITLVGSRTTPGRGSWRTLAWCTLAWCTLAWCTLAWCSIPSDAAEDYVLTWRRVLCHRCHSDAIQPVDP